MNSLKVLTIKDIANELGMSESYAKAIRQDMLNHYKVKRICYWHLYDYLKVPLQGLKQSEKDKNRQKEVV